jgi:cell division protein ZapA
MSEAQSISIRLGNRQYKLKVAIENEESVRQSLVKITEKTNQLKQQFPGRDEQDYLAMTLIDYITTHTNQPLVVQTNEPVNNTELHNRLQKISILLDT